jgi:hypothetical protein
MSSLCLESLSRDSNLWDSSQKTDSIIKRDCKIAGFKMEVGKQEPHAYAAASTDRWQQ